MMNHIEPPDSLPEFEEFVARVEREQVKMFQAPRVHNRLFSFLRDLAGRVDAFFMV